jgi:hypothetical protein
MNQCTQNSTETLINGIISTILNNVNTGVRFFQACSNTPMRVSLEETIRENLPFAELAAKQSVQGKYVLEKLTEMYNDVYDCPTISIIELPENKKVA